MVDFVFLYPQWLIALAPLGLALYWYFKSSSSSGLIASHIAVKLGLKQKVNRKPAVAIIGTCWLLTTIALSGPSFQKAPLPAFDIDSARILVLDMSRSLYAKDIKPNRLTQVKYKALDLLPYWKEGNTGLIAYAGDAYTISPLTSDSKTLENLIVNLSPEIMPYPGANAASAVSLAIETFHQSGYGKGEIIIIADDIDKQEQAEISKQTKNSNWKISVLAVGTREGAPIELRDGSLLSNAAGIPVVAKTSIQNMQEIAKETGGLFMPIQNDNSDVERIGEFTAKADLNAAKQDSQSFEERVNNGFWLLPLLLIPALYLFRKGAIFVLVIGFTSAYTPKAVQAGVWQNSDQDGYQLFQNKQYADAAASFDDQYWKGLAQYEAGDYESAIENLKNQDSEEAKYNLANAYAQSGDLDKAKNLYKDILHQNPEHQSAQKNLDVIEQAQQQQQQQQQQQDSQDQSGNQADDSQNNSDNSNQNNDSSKQGASSEPQQDSGQSAQNQSQDKSGSEQENREQSSQEKKEEGDATEQKSQATQRQSSEENNDTQEQTEATAAQADNSEQIDPELRKLEQVENARDPGRLIKAQMILQAREKETPKNSGKTW